MRGGKKRGENGRKERDGLGKEGDGMSKMTNPQSLSNVKFWICP